MKDIPLAMVMRMRGRHLAILPDYQWLKQTLERWEVLVGYYPNAILPRGYVLETEEDYNLFMDRAQKVSRVQFYAIQKERIMPNVSF